MGFGTITQRAAFTIWGAKTGFDIKLTATDSTVLELQADKTQGIRFLINGTTQWTMTP